MIWYLNNAYISFNYHIKLYLHLLHRHVTVIICFTKGSWCCKNSKLDTLNIYHTIGTYGEVDISFLNISHLKYYIYIYTVLNVFHFFSYRTPEQCPQVVSLLSESYNPHVRFGAAMALGIACAGTGLKV